VLESIGAAKIVHNEELEKINLNEYIKNLIYDKELLKQMGEKAKSVSGKNSLEIIYKEIEKLLHKC